MVNKKLDEVLGVLGLGNIGLGIANNLQRSGLGPIGIDILEERCQLLVAEGARATADLSQAITELDVIIVCLISDKQINAVFTDTILSKMKKNAVIIITSTVSVEFITQFACTCATYGIQVLDAPVSGGQVGAETGSLSIFAAGPDTVLERAIPALTAVSKKIYRLGQEVGLGSKYKIAHQLIAGIHIVAAAETIAVAKKSGLNVDLFYDIVNNSGGQSWLFTDRVPRMISQDYHPRSDVNIFIKDLTLALELAQNCGVDSRLGEKSLEQFQKAATNGYGSKDDSSVVELY